MRFLVTGGVGFIGTNLIKRLLKDGHDIVSLDNYSTGLKKNEQDGALYNNVDISDYKNFDQFIEGIDLVFHLAALSDIDKTIKNRSKTILVNILGTKRLLEESQKVFDRLG